MSVIKRRKFIKAASIAAASSFYPGGLSAQPQKLKILFLGGTGFIGPHTVTTALAHGHDVTLFNRGRSNPGLFGNLETIIGDRNTDDINQLRGRQWDVVIDTSTYFPRSITSALNALDNKVKQYVLISTISVYTHWSAGADESTPLRTVADPTIEEVRQAETYGGLKALSEQAAEKHLPGRVTTIRPGFIVGPGDRTDRFTYWPVRVARGGEMLAPGNGADGMQFIDVRDLGEWIIHCLENNITGIFNAHSPAGSLTLKNLLTACEEALHANVEITWADIEFLRQHDLGAGSFPLWQPGGLALSSEKAVTNGLQQRPLAETIADTFNWFTSLPPDRRAHLNAGIDPKTEQQVLAAWHQLKDKQ